MTGIPPSLHQAPTLGPAPERQHASAWVDDSDARLGGLKDHAQVDLKDHDTPSIIFLSWCVGGERRPAAMSYRHDVFLKMFTPAVASVRQSCRCRREARRQRREVSPPWTLEESSGRGHKGMVWPINQGPHKPSKTWFSLAKKLVLVRESLYFFSWFRGPLVGPGETSTLSR